MYDMRNLIPRYFRLILKTGTELEVEPPSIKNLKKMAILSQLNNENMTEAVIEDLIKATSLALSKNKQNIMIAPEYIEENYNIDDLLQILTNYYSWVVEIQNQKN